jgi:regulator of protease activity HflC (stomatin/prohibitin superfamily)
MGLLIFFGVLLTASIIISAISVKQVSQGTVRLVERLGRYHRMLKPGISFIIPIVDSIKTDARLYTYLNDAQVQQPLINAKGGISTKEEILDPGPFDTIANDNAIVYPDVIVYFRIIDPVKAIYGVGNLGESMLKLVETTLRQEIGKLNSDALISSREVVGSHVQVALERASEAWGTKIMRVEIQEIRFSNEVQKNLTRAREAELNRRANVVTAQEQRDTEILRAEGQKEANVRIAQGNFEAAKLQAESDFLLASKKLEGEAKGIKAIAEAMRENTDAIVAIKALEAQQAIAEHLGHSNSMMILPAETAGLVGAAGSILKGLEFTRFGDRQSGQKISDGAS